MDETSVPAASKSAAVSGSELLQMAVPRPKLRPPQSSCISFVYTRTRPPAGMTISGNVNVGLSSDTSTRRQRFMSWASAPVLTISTYSSGSCLDATPSKKMQAIATPASPGGEGLEVGVSVGAGVGVGVSAGTAVGCAVDVGVGERVGRGVAVGAGVGEDVTDITGVAVEAIVAVGTGVVVLVAVGLAVASGV